MHLSQRDPQHADRFRSSHSLHYDLPDGRTLLMLSGSVDIDLKAPGWSQESPDTPPYRLDLALDLLLPADLLAPDQRFAIEQSLPVVGLGSLAGSGNVLWGIQAFAVAAAQPVSQVVRLTLEAEVARSAEVLHAVVYSVTLLGRRSQAA